MVTIEMRYAYKQVEERIAPPVVHGHRHRSRRERLIQEWVLGELLQLLWGSALLPLVGEEGVPGLVTLA